VQKFRTGLKHWLPPLIWMAVIFSASSDNKSAEHTSKFFEPLLHWLFPHMSQPHIEAIHHVFRKCGHLTEYAILALLLRHAIRKSRKNQPAPPVAPEHSEAGWRWDEAGLALALVFLYGATDELHQVFVATRTAQVSDVLIDTSGGALGLFALWIFVRWLKRMKE
jgi:VanZ family protein